MARCETPCGVLHGYTEKSARAKLERHRARGDWDVAAVYHEECGQWHVDDWNAAYYGGWKEPIEVVERAWGDGVAKWRRWADHHA